MAIDGNRVVINKIQKKIFVFDGSELRPVCQLSRDGTMQWEINIEQLVQDRYTAIIADRQESRRSSQVSLPPVEGGVRCSAHADIPISKGRQQEVQIFDS